jgi:hypothetical protein
MPRSSIVGRFGIGIGISLVAVLLPSCGGGGGTGEDAPPVEAAGSQPEGRGTVARADFVLCPAVEKIADDLASLAGFTRDTDQQIQGPGSECVVRGEQNGRITIAMPPAIIQSIAMHAGGYDAEPSPVPELGPDAVYLAVRTQPHVVFPLLGHIIDVGAEGAIDPPDQATMVALAKLVRDTLLAANGGA